MFRWPTRGADRFVVPKTSGAKHSTGGKRFSMRATDCIATIVTH